MLKLSEKERLYLEDAQSHEQLCVAKYNSYSQTVSSQELKQVLEWAGQQEAVHLQSIEQIMNGRIPSIGGYSSDRHSWQIYGMQGERSVGPYQSQDEPPTWQIYAAQGQRHFVEGEGDQRPSWQIYGPQAGTSNRRKLSVEQVLNQIESSVSPQGAGSPTMQDNIASQTEFTGRGQLSDRMICNDLLVMEKELTDLYDHAVTETTNPKLQQILSQIEKEERDHALVMSKYMELNGWFQA